MTCDINVFKLNPLAVLPTRSSPDAAGWDLYAIRNTLLPPSTVIVVDTGIVMQLPKGYYGRIAPRSGLMLNYSLDVKAGVIDSDYRGPVTALMYNYSDEDYEVLAGQRIAQIIIEKILDDCRMVECDKLSDLSCTARGGCGFGSSGI